MKELKDTVELMCSEDFKERIVAEWLQLVIRKEKLEAYAEQVFKAPKNKMEVYLLKDQIFGMEMYKDALEARACELGIDLESYK